MKKSPVGSLATGSKAKDGPVSLPPGQQRIIQAAFEAGVKPAAIARQFRLSRAQVDRCIGAAQRSARQPARRWSGPWEIWSVVDAKRTPDAEEPGAGSEKVFRSVTRRRLKLAVRARSCDKRARVPDTCHTRYMSHSTNAASRGRSPSPSVRFLLRPWQHRWRWRP